MIHYKFIVASHFFPIPMLEETAGWLVLNVWPAGANKYGVHSTLGAARSTPSSLSLLPCVAHPSLRDTTSRIDSVHSSSSSGWNAGRYETGQASLSFFIITSATVIYTSVLSMDAHRNPPVV